MQIDSMLTIKLGAVSGTLKDNGSQKKNTFKDMKELCSFLETGWNIQPFIVI